MVRKNEWQAQQLRISVFPTGEEFDFSKELWPDIQGIDIENESTDRKSGTMTYRGSFKKYTLALTVTPVKIDLILTTPSPLHLEEGKPVVDTIGSLSECLNIFYSITDAWLANKNFPEITRIAFGARLMQALPSREEVYTFLSEYVPFRLDPSRMGDFNFKLNLFAQSKVRKGLTINRLSTWSSAQATSELAFAGAAKSFPPIYFGHVEIDINTSQDNNEKIDKNVLRRLYAELVTLGTELSEKGVVQYAK